MACEAWRERIDAYLDGELQGADERLIREHLRGCAVCATDSLDRMRLKRALQIAGRRYAPDSAFRSRVEKSITSKPRSSRWRWLMPLLAATSALLIVVVLLTDREPDQVSRHQLTSELVDLHVATLASSNPVDVFSTDRHTVKPWFEGKVPFTFNLPDLAGTPFTLVGGKVSYVNQTSGAELIFRARQHQLSAFLFPDRAFGSACGGFTAANTANFTVLSWNTNGLCYFVVGDTSAEELGQLGNLLHQIPSK